MNKVWVWVIVTHILESLSTFPAGTSICISGISVTVHLIIAVEMFLETPCGN